MQPYPEAPNTSNSATLVLPPFCCHLPGHQATLLLASLWMSSNSSVASLGIKSTMELPPNTPQPKETAAQGGVSHSVNHASNNPPPSWMQDPHSTAALPSNLHPIPTLPPFLSVPSASALTPNLSPILTLPPIFSPTNATNQPLTHKCNCKGCPSFPPVQLFEQCGYSECSRMVHYVCYANMIKKSNKTMWFWREMYFVPLGIRKSMSKASKRIISLGQMMVLVGRMTQGVQNII